MDRKHKGKSRSERHHRGHSGVCSYCEAHRLHPKRCGPCTRHGQADAESRAGQGAAA